MFPVGWAAGMASRGFPPVKNSTLVCWRGYLSGWGADLHMVQLMPLPLTVSCFSKSRLVLRTFWYRLARIFADKWPLNWRSSSSCSCCCCLLLFVRLKLLLKLKRLIAWASILGGWESNLPHFLSGGEGMVISIAFSTNFLRLDRQCQMWGVDVPPIVGEGL